MIEKILNNTTSYGKNRASHEGSLHSSTLSWLDDKRNLTNQTMYFAMFPYVPLKYLHAEF